MPTPPEATDANIWTAFWFGLGGVFSTMGAGFVFLLGLISKNADDERDSHEKMWDQINNQGKADVMAALDAEKRFATKADIDRLELRLMEQMRSLLREHEINVKRDIEFRIGRNGD